MNVKRKASVIALAVLTVMSLAAFSLGVFGLSEPSAKAEETSEVSATVTVENESGAVTPNATRDGVNYYLSSTEGNKLKITFGEFSADEKAVVTYGGSTFTANSANATVTADFVGGVLEIAYYNGETLVKTEKNANNVLLKGVEGFSSSEAISGLYYALGGKWAETEVTTDGEQVACFGSPVGAEADFDLYAFGYYGALGVEAAVSDGTGANLAVYLNGALDTGCTLRSDLDNKSFNQNSGTTISKWTDPTTVRLSNENFNKLTLKLAGESETARAFVKNLVAIPGFNPEEVSPATLKIGDSEDLVTATKNGTVACDFVGKSVTVTAPAAPQSYVDGTSIFNGASLGEESRTCTLYVVGKTGQVDGVLSGDGEYFTFAAQNFEDGCIIKLVYYDMLLTSRDFMTTYGIGDCEIFYEYTFTLKTPGTVVTVGGKTLSEAALIEKDGVYYILNEDGAENNVKVSFIGTLSETTSAKITYGANTVTVNGDSSAQNDVTLENYAGGNVTIEYLNEAGETSSTEVYKIVLLKSLGVDGLYYSNEAEYPWSFVYNEDGTLNYMQSYEKDGKFGVAKGESIINIYGIGVKHLAFSVTQSSFYNYDYIHVVINGYEENPEKYKGTGNAQKEWDLFEWSKESHTFEDSSFNTISFIYRKAGSFAFGLDRAFVKDINTNGFDVSNIGKVKADLTINGTEKVLEVENGGTLEFLFTDENEAVLNAPVLNQGEECYVYVTGGNVIGPLVEGNGYYVYPVTSFGSSEIVFAYTREEFVDFYYTVNIKATLNGTIQENLVVSGDISVDNTKYSYPLDFNSTISQKNKIGYATTNNGIASSSSGVVLTVKESGVLTFDYYISCENYDVVYYNISDTLITSDNKKEQQFLTGSQSTSAGIQGWNNIVIPVSVTDAPVKIHIAYVKDYFGEEGDDLFAIANVKYLVGDTTVKAEISNAEGGSVTIKDDNGSVLGNSGTLTKGGKATFTATVNDGYIFYAWKNLSTGKLFLERDLTVELIDDEVVYKAIIEKKGTFAARDEYNLYNTFIEAFAGGEKALYVIGDYTLNENATIPENVTVILPYSGDDTTGYKAGGTTSRVSWNAGINPYVTLTINSGVTFTVNGKLIVGGVQHYKDQSAQGHTSGDYAKIVNNGSLIVNGNMDVIGLVEGSGTLTVNSGAELKQPFMINNYSGGTDTKNLYDNGQFPFAQFSTVNVQCKQIINYGAKVVGSTSLFFWSSIHEQDVNLVYPKGGFSGGSIIWMEEGSRLEITYKNKTINQTVGNIHLGDSGVCTIAVYGNITAGGFELQGYSSSDKVLGIPYTYNFELKSGSKVTIEHKYKILPGAVVIVEKGAELDITADGGLYVYDGLIQSDKDGKLYSDASVLEKYGFDKSGMLIVDGKLTIDGAFAGIVQTNGSGEIVVSNAATVGEQEIVDGSEGGASGDKSSNKTVFKMTGRIYGLYGFVNLQAGKTYKANGNEQFTLENFTVDSASRITELTVTLNQQMTGRFFEFDGENFVSEVEFSVDLEDGATVYINGTAYTVGGGKITATLTFGADRKFSYYTGGKETSLAAHEGEIQADTATVLGYAVKSVELSESNVYEIAEGENFELKAVITYADGTEEVELTVPSFTTYVLKNASLTSEKLAVSFTRDLTVVKTALSDYIASVEALDDLPGDKLVEAAKNRYAAYGELVKGLNADDLAFVNGKIGDKQAYASEIVKEFSAEDYCFTYGDDGAPVTLTMVDGSTKPGVAGIVACFPGNQVVAATILYRGYYKDTEKYYDLYFNRDILVNPLEISVKWTVGSYVYDGTEHKPEATLSGVLADDVGEVAVIVKGAINAGEQTAIATLSGKKAPCYAIKTTDSSVTFTIEKASATVTVEEKLGVDTAAKYIKFSVNGNGILGDDEIICTYKISRNGVLVATVDDEGNITLEEGQSLAPGEYDVNVEAENDNYSFAYNAGKLTVTAADDYYTLTIVGGDSRTFDGGVFKPEVKAVVAETGEEETLITLSYGVIRNAGIYEIKVKVGALEKEYTLQLRVTAKEISLDWDVSGLVYDGTAKKPSATIKAGELADGDEVTLIVATAVDYVNAGKYTASASLGGTNAGNYVITNATAEFTVSPASVEITIEDATSVYGENAATVRLNSASELYGKKLSEIVEIVCEVTSESNVGTYDISLIGKDENFTITFEKGRYFVTKRAITVTIDNKSSVYGEAFAALTANVTSGSIVNGDENVFALVKEDGTSAGEYAITTDSSLDNENYLITVTPGVYTIEKRKITVKVNNSESVYGEKFAALTSEISEGSFAEGDDLSGVVKLTKAEGEIVGTYAITAENVNANYSLTFVYTAGDRSLYEITKREVVLTIKNNEFSYTDDISDMKLVVAVKDGYSLKDGETLEVLNLEYTIKQNGIVLTSKTLRGGDWRYSASYSNDNYSITFENADDDTLDYGILTITKPVLELADLTAEHTYSGEPFAYYDYESAVTFKANSTADDFGCELYFGGKKVDEMKNAGTYTVRVILKSSAAFALKDGVDGGNYKDYTVIVNKKDITEQIGFVCEDGVTTENGIYVPLGNYTQISSTLNGTAIGFTELLTFGGEESELNALGEYKYKVTVKDDNYSGEKEFTLIVVPSIEVKSANLKKYTAEYYEIRTSANADKVRNLFAKLTDSDRILFTNAKHSEIYSAAENVEGAHVDYLKETLNGKISAFEKEQSYASILEAREVALDLTAFKTGEDEEEIAAYETAWNEYFETLTNDGASASGIADYMSLAAALVSASAALLAITKRIAL